MTKDSAMCERKCVTIPAYPPESRRPDCPNHGNNLARREPRLHSQCFKNNRHSAHLRAVLTETSPDIYRLQRRNGIQSELGFVLAKFSTLRTVLVALTASPATAAALSTTDTSPIVAMAPSTVSDPVPVPAEDSSSTSVPTESGVLHLIGLGLGDEHDITVRGLQLVRSAGAVYLEAYTSILGVSTPALEKLYGRSVIVADREFVEERAEAILSDAASLPGGAAFLVVGDPFGATTHTDLWLRARERGLRVNVVHNASIVNAIAETGLQLYLFGQAISLCFWTETDRPTSYYPKLVENRKLGLHTLCLLDIKVKEPSLESLARGKKVYEPARYMTVSQAVDQLLEIDRMLQVEELNEDSMAVGVARMGQPDQLIIYASLGDLRTTNFGPPLHSLVVPARELHFHEEEVLACMRLKENEMKK